MANVFSKRLKTAISLLGPGIFAIGYTIGTGSVTSMAKAGADYGLGLLWVLALSCLFSGVLMTAYGRFAAVTGETTLHGIARFLPGGKWIAAFLFLGVVTAQYTCLGGILILTSGAIREAFGLNVGVFPIACAIMAMMLAFAMVGRYAFFEKVLSAFVALMALAFLASVFATWPAPDVLARAARPLLPGSGASLLMLAAFVGTTMAAPTFVTRPLIIREKGLAADDLAKERIDSTVSASLMFVISGSIVLVATDALFARGATISSVLDMAETLRPLAGRFAVAIFLCGTLAAGLSSVFPILMVAPLLVGDWRSGRMETRSATFRVLCVIASAWGLVVPALGKNPVAVTIAAQVSNVFVLPLAVAAILWLLNRRDVMGTHRAGLCLNALLALAFVFSVAVAFAGGKALCAQFRRAPAAEATCPQAATDDVFKGGLWRTFDYAEPTAEPVVFGGESRCEDAVARDYCIWLDIWYDDGTPVWQRRAEWTPGSHDWERTTGAFVPARPVKKIEMHVFLRNGTGRAEFRNLWLERREGSGDVLSSMRMTSRPYADGDVLIQDRFTGKEIRRETVTVPEEPGAIANPLADGETVVWTSDSMRRITPLTFPDAAGRTDVPEASVSLARRERESFQVQVSTGADVEWTDGGVTLSVLRNAAGEPLKGSLDWRRVGYVRREPGYYPHPLGAPSLEMWLPDPLLPPAPFKVRRGSTQGLWFTVHADADAAPGEYTGDIALTERGERRATVRLTVEVEDFSLPETFGMPTSFSVMDGFTRAQYPDRFAEKKRESWDIMLDHRLNPDDISRTEPPDIGDLVYARSRGMNLFNILNIVPPPKDPNAKWVCWVPPEATEDPAFYPAFQARLAPYVAELRKRGLEKFAYIYGFDERESEYYSGIDALWRKLKADFPDIPVMTTAMMYRDYAAGNTNLPCLLTTDWYCPLTDVYRTDVSDVMRKLGKKVWWYVCCQPTYPHANFASIEYPPVEGRILGWMTHLFRADGLLFWHVNYWDGPCIDEGDTFLPEWKTASPLRMPGDGILLYPGKEHILPSIRLAQVRDGVEDYEWLQLAAAKAGADAADAASKTLVRSMTDFTRDPAAVRAARDRLAEIITVHREGGA